MTDPARVILECSEECGGNGWIDCWGCGGDGFVYDEDFEDELKCQMCEGHGGWRCPVCSPGVGP